MIFRSTILLISLSVFSSNLAADKLYKIVDENGNVTFSQFPPVSAQQQDGATVEELQVKNEGSPTLVTKGETSFCGNIELPRKRERKDYFFSDVASRTRQWEKQLERMVKQLKRTEENYARQSSYRSKYRSNSSLEQTASYMERSKKTNESIRHLQCAVKWGKQQLEGSFKAKEQMNLELSRLQKSLQAIHSRRLAKCGAEPIYDPAVEGNKRQRKRWSKCSSEYRRDVRKLETLIRNESRKLEKF